MSTLSQFPKPEAGQYAGRRKLFLVPLFALPPGIPEDGAQLLERYWSEVRDHVGNLERSLGAVSHVFHETVFSEGDEGLKMVEALNPGASAFVQAMCRSTASLEATEDRDLVEENSDWQRCISIGLMSQKVISAALDEVAMAATARPMTRLPRRKLAARDPESRLLNTVCTLPPPDFGIHQGLGRYAHLGQPVIQQRPLPLHGGMNQEGEIITLECRAHGGGVAPHQLLVAHHPSFQIDEPVAIAVAIGGVT